MKITNHYKSFSSAHAGLLVLKALDCLLARIPIIGKHPIEDELTFYVCMNGPLATVLGTLGKRKKIVDDLVHLMNKLPSEKARWMSRLESTISWALNTNWISPGNSKHLVEHVFALAIALRLPLRPLEDFALPTYANLHACCSLENTADRFELLYTVDHWRANSRCTDFVCLHCGQYEYDYEDDGEASAIAKKYKCCGG